MRDEQHPKGRIPIRDKRVTAEGDAAGSGASSPEPSSPQIEELQKLADDRLDQLMRLKADFENFRKREIRQRTELIERASLRIVERLLPVLDDLERAIDAARSHEGGDAIVRGVDIVRKQLHEVLASEGLEQVIADGTFDPEHHEAVGSIPGDVAEPTVLEVVRPGYRLKGKTIRPALVNVEVPQAGGE